MILVLLYAVVCCVADCWVCWVACLEFDCLVLGLDGFLLALLGWCFYVLCFWWVLLFGDCCVLFFRLGLGWVAFGGGLIMLLFVIGLGLLFICCLG